MCLKMRAVPSGPQKGQRTVSRDGANPASGGREAKQDRQLGFPFLGGLGVPACIAHKDNNRVRKHSRS